VASRRALADRRPRLRLSGPAHRVSRGRAKYMLINANVCTLISHLGM